MNAVLERVLAADPENRFASAGELLDALDDPRSATTARLVDRLACPACGTPSCLELGFCPGCGVDVDRRLEPGPYSVWLTDIPDPIGVQSWLEARHMAALNGGSGWLLGRLSWESGPVALVSQASLASAERLKAEAIDAGAKAEVLRVKKLKHAWRVLAHASVGELKLAALAHAAVVLGAGAFLAASGAELSTLLSLPLLVLVGGFFLGERFIRRPLLSAESAEGPAAPSSELERVLNKLRRLKSQRARRIAASAVARAAPALGPGPLAEEDRQRIHSVLSEALNAALEIDAHAPLLMGSSRVTLGEQIKDAEAAVERGVPGAVDRRAALEVERSALTEVALAHDLAARRALEACVTLSAEVRMAQSFVPRD
jgi:hypothetical protein